MNKNNFDYNEWLKIITLFKKNTKLNQINDVKKININELVKNIQYSKKSSVVNVNIQHKSQIKEIPKAPLLEIKKIKNNKIKIEKYLDLHGLTLSTAEEVFCDFIQDSYNKKLRLLLIITGKGDNNCGVLKENFVNWIYNIKVNSYILYYAQSLNKDGGLGAYYVFLKKNF